MDPRIAILLFGAVIIAVILWNIITMKIPSEKLTPESMLHPVLFRDGYASGRSRESLLTRMIWARYDLKVYVTPEVVRIIPRQPYRRRTSFSYLDLEIPLTAIVDVSAVTTLWGKTSVVVKYLDSGMHMKEVELLLRRYQDFVRSICGW